MKVKMMPIYVDGETIDAVIFLDIDENGNHVIKFHAWHGEVLQIEEISVSSNNVTLLESIIYDFSVMAAESFYNSYKANL